MQKRKTNDSGLPVAYIALRVGMQQKGFAIKCNGRKAMMLMMMMLMIGVRRLGTVPHTHTPAR